MTLQEFHPTPITIPGNVPIQRKLRRDRDDYDGRPLSSAELARYDSRTIFYDVWIMENPRRLTAIGPPTINLDRELPLQSVTCNGQKLLGRKTEYRQYCTYTALLPGSEPVADTYRVKFAFAQFNAEISVRPAPNLEPTATLSMITLQKDNPVPWIKDWCRWHHRLHGVNRIFIYDNASVDSAKLHDALQAIDDAVEIVLVHWPFPYGPPTSDRNRFGQTGALNHQREVFGQTAGWTIRLDVDEYLAVADGMNLIDRLHEHGEHGTDVVLFGSWEVPPAVGQPAIPQRSIRSYNFRAKEFTGFALKYAFNPVSVRVNKNHIAFPKGGVLEGLIGAPAVYEKLASLWYRSITKRGGQHWPLLGRRVVLEPHDCMYFYHFRGLNTNWKYREQLGSQEQQFDPARHVRDARLGQLITRASMDG